MKNAKSLLIGSLVLQIVSCQGEDLNNLRLGSDSESVQSEVTAFDLTIKQAANLKEAVDIVKSYRQEAFKNVKAAGQSCQQLEAALSELKAKHIKDGGPLAQHVQTRDEIRDLIVDLRKQRSATNASISENEAELEKVLGILSGQTITQLDQRKKNIQVQIKNLQGKLKSLEDTLDRMDSKPLGDLTAGQMSEKSQGWPTLNDQIDQTNDQIERQMARLRKTNRAIKKENEEFSDSQASLEKTIKRLKAKSQTLTGKIRDQRKILAAVNDDIAQLADAAVVGELSVPNKCSGL